MIDPRTVPHSLRDRRRLAIAHSATVRGLDHVEAQRQLSTGPDGAPAAADRFVLLLYFVPSAPVAATKDPIPPGLTTNNFKVSVAGGGDPGLRIVGIRDASIGREANAANVLPLVAERLEPQPLGPEGAFGPGLVYTLSLFGVPNVDRFFGEASFTLDGTPPPPEQSVPTVKSKEVEPAAIDYLAKDYESFRRLMLERMTLAVPSWTERNPSDYGIAVIEVLAYAADNLSYFQDAVATEAYLGTARRRVSLARHARLLDYSIGNGANARTWLQVDVSPDAKKLTLKRGTPVYAEGRGAPSSIAVAGAPVHEESYGPDANRLPSSNTFEVMADTLVVAEHLVMPLYTWGAMELTLPAGTTSAALTGSFPDLEAGDVLILAPVESTALDTAKNAPLGHPVRLAHKPRCTTDPTFGTEITEVAWFAGDALPAPLTIAGRIGGTLHSDLAVVLGNLVPIDQGQTVTEMLQDVLPAIDYAPSLGNRWVTQASPFDPVAARRLPAIDFLHPKTRWAVPQVELLELSAEGDSIATWRPVPDLLSSGPFSDTFVVEVESDGTASLRFGDGQFGRRPLAGTRFRATYRIGLGADGNLGPGTINRLEMAGVQGVGNPLQAVGGTNPESEDRIRLLAPQALAAQERCVTEADFVDAAESFPGVRRAAASLVWTGSWTTAFVFVEREGGRPFDPYFRASLDAYLEPRVLAGTALRILAPRYLPLDIALTVHRRPSVPWIDVQRALTLAFSAVDPAGYFSPDRFTFGQPVFLSSVIAQATAVSGVERVDVLRFGRWGQPPRGEIASGRIQPEPLEIVRADSAAGAPQLGGIEFLRGDPR